MLDALTEGAREALGDNFVGAYLVGSFAVGDADEHSDVDFIVATRRDPGEQEQEALQELHGRLYELPTPWAQHLEGSYVPADALREPDPKRTFFYLDNGSRELVWDTHCNTAVVRWTLQEHGIVLAGHKVDVSVGPDDLRDEARAALDEYATWARERPSMSRWLQPYLVLSFCRMLHTLDSATVVSKRVAGEWALRELDPRWHDLIAAALADRPDPWLRVHQPAREDAVARTRQFIEYALAHGADQRAARDDQRGADRELPPHALRVPDQQEREPDAPERLRRDERRDDRHAPAPVGLEQRHVGKAEQQRPRARGASARGGSARAASRASANTVPATRVAAAAVSGVAWPCSARTTLSRVAKSDRGTGGVEQPARAQMPGPVPLGGEQDAAGRPRRPRRSSAAGAAARRGRPARSRRRRAAQRRARPMCATRRSRARRA